MTDSAFAPVHDLLVDSFTRVAELVADFRDCPPDIATTRPGQEANTIAWLLWHLTRVQDDHIADLAEREQVWADGWYDRFALPLPFADTGYGHTTEEVGRVTTPPADLADYHADVHSMTLDYIANLTRTELERVIDRAWDPPVTTSVRLVSVLGDCHQHLGQAAYVRGLLT